MQEKYYLYREQYDKMEAPTLKCTKLNMAIKVLNFEILSKTLVILHEQARDMAKVGLREHEMLRFGQRVQGWGSSRLEQVGQGQLVRGRRPQVNILMCPWSLIIATFLAGHMWSAAVQDGAKRGDKVPNMELNSALVNKFHKVDI